MIKHSKEFESAAKITNKSVQKIDLSAIRLLTEDVIIKFCRSDYKYPIWDNLIDYIGVDFQYSWEWFNNLLLNKEVILFFEPSENDVGYFISNGAEIPDILNNAYRFTFYITNASLSFLFSYNDHDNLIASGEAMSWLENFVINNHPEIRLFVKKV